MQTKEWGHVHDYIKAGGDIPAYDWRTYVILPQVGQASKLPAALAAHPRISFNGDRSQIDPNYGKYVCPASQSGSSGCVDEESDACWRE